MKFYTSPSFNNLPLTDVKTYDEASINALFSDLATPEELEKFRGIIVDSIVSQYFVYSSNKTMEEINKAKSETNQFASELFAKVSTMSISYVTTLPDVSQASENIIYILEKTVDTTTVHTINLYDKVNNKFIECGSIEASLQNYYTKDEIDTKLTNDYALKTEVLKTDDLTTEITETSTNGEVPTALSVKNAIDNASVKISAEADNQIVEKTDGIYVAPEQVDNTLSTTSTNPLQNKVVKEELDKKIDKTSIVTSVSSSSTDTEVASAKAIFYNIINGKLGNLKIDYTYDTSDSFNILLPKIGLYKFGAPIKGAPTNNVGDYVLLNIPWGSLDFDTTMQFGTQLLFSPRNRNSFWHRTIWNYNKDTYVYTEGDYSVFSKWKNVCTTSVEDKDATAFTFNFPSQLTLHSQSNQYYIHNGVCYVDICIVISGSTNTVGWEDISTGVLPKPKYGFTETLNTVNGTNPSLGLNFLQDGRVLLYSETNPTGTAFYYAHTSYQVAEN